MDWPLASTPTSLGFVLAAVKSRPARSPTQFATACCRGLGIWAVATADYDRVARRVSGSA
jgi:hypothetical protein